MGYLDDCLEARPIACSRQMRLAGITAPDAFDWTDAQRQKWAVADDPAAHEAVQLLLLNGVLGAAPS